MHAMPPQAKIANCGAVLDERGKKLNYTQMDHRNRDKMYKNLAEQQTAVRNHGVTWYLKCHLAGKTAGGLTPDPEAAVPQKMEVDPPELQVLDTEIVRALVEHPAVAAEAEEPFVPDWTAADEVDDAVEEDDDHPDPPYFRRKPLEEDDF